MRTSTRPAPASRATLSCRHHPPCPTHSQPGALAAVIVAAHPEQGWNLLCNGIITFDVMRWSPADALAGLGFCDVDMSVSRVGGQRGRSRGECRDAGRLLDGLLDPGRGDVDDELLDCLMLMLETAAAEIRRHARGDAGRCGECGEVFPCARAVQADLALAGF